MARVSNCTYVCLDCCVTAKAYWFRKPTCTRCRKPMVDMGKRFKAPPKRDVKAWEAVRAFVARGLRGHSSYNARRIEKRAPRTANQVERLIGTIDEVYARKYIKPEVRKILSK